MIYLYFDTDVETYAIEQVLGDECGLTFILTSREYPSLEKLIEDIIRRNFSLLTTARFPRNDTDLKRNKIKEYNYSNLKIFVEQEFPEYFV